MTGAVLSMPWAIRRGVLVLCFVHLSPLRGRRGKPCYRVRGHRLEGVKWTTCLIRNDVGGLANFLHLGLAAGAS